VGDVDVGEDKVVAALVRDFGEFVEGKENVFAGLVGERVLDKRGEGGGLEED